MKLKNLTTKQKLAIFTTIAITIFAMPQLLRTLFHHDSMLGTTTYYHSRMTDLVASGAEHDPLSFGGRPMTYPYGFSLMILATPAAKYLLAPLIGGLGIIIGYHFTRELGLTKKQSLYSAMFLFFNPAYAYFASHLNPRLPAMVLMVLAHLMIQKNDRKINYLAAAPILLALITSPLIGASMLVIGIIIFRKKIKRTVTPFTIGFIGFLAYFLPIITENGLFHRYEAYNIFVEMNRGIQYFVFESGLTAVSFTFAMIIMAIYGFFKLNTENLKPMREWLFIGVLASLAIFNRMNDLLIYPVSIIAGTVFATHFHRFKKAIKIDRIPTKHLKTAVWTYLVILVIVPGIGMIMIDPEPEQHEVMTWIKNNTSENATITAHWNEGHYITGIAQRKNVMDPYLEFAPEVDERYRDIRRVLSSSQPEETINIMEKYNSNYMLYRVSPMETCSGFPYVSKHGRFKEIYSNQEYRVYQLMDEPVSPESDLCEESIRRAKEMRNET